MGNKMATYSRSRFFPKYLIPKNILKPLIVVLGGTGCGKSKLALELAIQFNGEIISADAMQVYQGLDIVTNKVSLEEQRTVPHYMINCVDPFQNSTVVDFRNRTLKFIDEISARTKLPIIVGGTNYYIESILWDFLVSPLEDGAELTIEREKASSCVLSKSENEPTLEQLFGKPIIPSDLDVVSDDHLHNLLTEVDSTRAKSLHPRDRRKVIRSLQVYQQHGKTHSELLSEQHCREGAGTISGPLRFPNTIVFWVRCDQDVLDNRLEKRVDEMIDKGMLDEIQRFHDCYNSTRFQNHLAADYTVGIFQSIGFKEFHDYVTLPRDQQSGDSAKKFLKIGLETMKQRTIRYSKTQVKWIKNRFLKRSDRTIPPVYGLDATHLDKWDENVKFPSFGITCAFLEGRTPEIAPLPVEEASPNVKETFYCDVCDRIFVGTHTWDEHVTSKRHQRSKTGRKRKEREHFCREIEAQ